MSLHCSFTFHASEDDFVHVPPDIWSRICQDQQNIRIGMSLSTVPSHPRISCWGIRGPESPDDHPGSLLLPSRWLEEYPELSRPLYAIKTLHVATAQPVHLTQIILSAFGDDAYRLASASWSHVQEYICADKNIIRQGAIFSMPPTALPTNGHTSQTTTFPYQFKIGLTEPVIQGYADQHTSFVIIRDDTSAMDTPHDSSEEEDIDINEAFLARSISATLEAGSQHSNISSSTTLRALPLPLSSPIRNTENNDDYSLYLRTADLGRLGALNGDWVTIQSNLKPH